MKNLPFALTCLSLAAPVHAQGYRLNDPLARSALGSVNSYRLDPTGTHVLFLADMDPAQSNAQVYSVPADGSAAAIQLTDMPSSILLHSVGVLADGSQVLFLGRFATTTRLYVVPTDGSLEPRQLNGEMLPDGAVLDYLVAPSGNRVVFRADKEIDGVFELYSRPADFSAEPVKLSGPMVSGGGVAEFRISPDGSRVVYRADQSADEVYDLYSAPLDGSAAPVRLNLSRPFADVVSDFAIAFDSLGVVYRADQDADEVLELYAVRIDGSVAPVKRNAALVSGGDVVLFELSSIDDRLLYRADQATNEVYELFSVRAITGGAPVRLNGPLVTQGDVLDMQLTPDARHALYRADQQTNEVDGLFVAPVDGSVPATLLSVLAPGETLGQTRHPLAPGRALYTAFDASGKYRLYSAVLDGSRAPISLFPAAESLAPQTVLSDGTLLATADLNFELIELFAVPIDGGSVRRLSAELVSYGRVFSSLVSAGDDRVVYLANQDHAIARELYSVPPSGGSTARLSPRVPLGATGSGVSRVATSRDGTRAVYSAPEESTAVRELFSVTTDGQRNSIRLNPSFGHPIIGFDEFHLSPDGTRVAYGLVRNDSSTVGLYSAPADRPGPAVLLDVVVRSWLPKFQFTPDSRHLVYLALRPSGIEELFLVPSDGSAPPTALHSPYGPLEADLHFEISPDGAWVVYARSSASGTEVFSLPLDLHRPPARLNLPMVPGGNLGGDRVEFDDYYPWTITPDARVLYFADQDTNDVNELYIVPIDASQAPIKLNATLVAGGDVALDPTYPGRNSPYLLSPDGTRVVYRADQEINGKVELYSVPSTGGAAVKLSGSLVSGGDVGFFAIDPDSARVVYLADQDTDEMIELYSAPLDGSSPAVKLSGTLASGGNVRSIFGLRPLAIGSDSRVAYLVESSVPFNAELWSAPLDGSAAPRRLHGALPENALVDYFELTPDGNAVLFAGDLLQAGTRELFHAPLDGSAAARRLNGPLVPGGNVMSDHPIFHVLANGLVLYIADQDTDEVVELYATQLDWQRGPRRSSPPTGSKTVHR